MVPVLQLTYHPSLAPNGPAGTEEEEDAMREEMEEDDIVEDGVGLAGGGGGMGEGAKDMATSSSLSSSNRETGCWR
jgi:hypothetical protein